MRFSRFIRLRDDKSIDEIETLDSIRERYSRQSPDENRKEKVGTVCVASPDDSP